MANIEARFGKDIARQIDALAPGEPFMVARHIPRCPECRAANPSGLPACPSCGAPAPAHVFRFERAVRTGGLKAWLRRFFGGSGQ